MPACWCCRGSALLWLSEVRHHAPGSPRTGRCRVRPALVARSSRNPGLWWTRQCCRVRPGPCCAGMAQFMNRPWSTDVAEPGPRCACIPVVSSQFHSRGALPGSTPGPSLRTVRPAWDDHAAQALPERSCSLLCGLVLQREWHDLGPALPEERSPARGDDSHRLARPDVVDPAAAPPPRETAVRRGLAEIRSHDATGYPQVNPFDIPHHI